MYIKFLKNNLLWYRSKRSYTEMMWVGGEGALRSLLGCGAIPCQIHAMAVRVVYVCERSLSHEPVLPYILHIWSGVLERYPVQLSVLTQVPCSEATQLPPHCVDTVCLLYFLSAPCQWGYALLSCSSWWPHPEKKLNKYTEVFQMPLGCPMCTLPTSFLKYQCEVNKYLHSPRHLFRFQRRKYDILLHAQI